MYRYKYVFTDEGRRCDEISEAHNVNRKPHCEDHDGGEVRLRKIHLNTISLHFLNFRKDAIATLTSVIFPQR